MTMPTDLPYWATVDETDPILGTPNKAVPTAEKQSYGQRANKNTLRQDINYLFNEIRKWIQFFRDQSQVGDVYIAMASASPTDTSISAQLGNTWNYIDGSLLGSTTTIAGQSVIVFKRTA